MIKLSVAKEKDHYLFFKIWVSFLDTEGQSSSNIGTNLTNKLGQRYPAGSPWATCSLRAVKLLPSGSCWATASPVALAVIAARVSRFPYPSSEWCFLPLSQGLGQCNPARGWGNAIQHRLKVTLSHSGRSHLNKATVGGEPGAPVGGEGCPKEQVL